MTQQDRELYNKINERLARIEAALIGNGTKGLNTRVSDIEDSQKSPKRVAVSCTVISTVMAVLILMMKLAGVW